MKKNYLKLISLRLKIKWIIGLEIEISNWKMENGKW